MGVKWFLGDQIDHAGHRTGTVKGGTAAFHNFDAVQEDRGNLVDTVDRGDPGEEWEPVNEDLIVVTGQAYELNLGRAAVLAVVLSPCAIQQLQRFAQLRGAGKSEVVAAEQIRLDRHIADQTLAASARRDDGEVVEFNLKR